MENSQVTINEENQIFSNLSEKKRIIVLCNECNYQFVVLLYRGKNRFLCPHCDKDVRF